MGFGNRENTRKIFFNISKGKIVQKVQEGTAGAISRINKDKKVVWEVFHDYVSGIIQSVEKEYNEKVKAMMWNITLKDGLDTYVLSMRYGEKLSDGFFYSIQNCNLFNEIKFEPWETISQETGKASNMLTLKQNIDGEWKAIKRLYTNKDPKGRPAKGTRINNGVQETDRNPINEWIDKTIVEGWLLPELQKVHSTTEKVAEIFPASAENETLVEDDLPF